MSGEVFHVPASPSRSEVFARVWRLFAKLPADKAYRVEVVEHKPKRSLSQNALLWALYDQIIERGGEAMQGWSREDLHTFFLMNHFGSETREIFGRKRLVPLRRSSGLNKQDFSDYVESIVRFMAERGVVLDMPEDTRG